MMKMYEDRNSIVIPFFQRIIDIEKERKDDNKPGLYEEEEHYIIICIEKRIKNCQKWMP